MRTAMARRTTESAGSWYWLARGSGVWLNLGRTYIDPEQRGESDWFFKKGGGLVRHLANEGLDTLQFPRLAGTSTYTGAPVNNDRFELVALREKPGLRGTCADGFRAGWDHDRACTCVEKVGVVNCRGASQLLTVRTGQHSFMRNVTFASLEPPLAPGEPLAAYLEHVYHEPPREPRCSLHRCSGSGGVRLFASTARGHMRARRNWSARLTPPREQSTSRPTLGSPCWASTASRFRHGASVVTQRRIRHRMLVPILPAAQWSSAGLSRSCASVRRSIGGATLACQRTTRGGWDAREEATAAGFVDAARFNRRLNTQTRAPQVVEPV